MFELYPPANAVTDAFPSGLFNQDMGFRTDILDEGDRFTLTAELPGFSREAIHVQVTEDSLVISAREEAPEEARYLRRERRAGQYTRRFRLTGIDTAAISAKYAEGLLTLTLPKTPAGQEDNASEIPIQ